MIQTKHASVLFVDDEDDILLILEAEFKKYFEHIYLANNGNLALEIVKNHEIDLAVLDLKMPQMDGISLCRKLKEIDHDLRYVFLTAHADRPSLQAAMELGAYEVVDKPFDSNLLKLTVKTSVEKSQYEKLIKNVLKLFIQQNTSLDFDEFNLLPFPKKEKIIHAALGVAQLQALKIPSAKKK